MNLMSDIQTRGSAEKKRSAGQKYKPGKEKYN